MKDHRNDEQNTSSEMKTRAHVRITQLPQVHNGIVGFAWENLP
ncbi:hypothetical protein ABTG52_12205 [Acinetobacter baumannii]